MIELDIKDDDKIDEELDTAAYNFYRCVRWTEYTAVGKESHIFVQSKEGLICVDEGLRRAGAAAAQLHGQGACRMREALTAPWSCCNSVLAESPMQLVFNNTPRRKMREEAVGYADEGSIPISQYRQPPIALAPSRRCPTPHVFTFSPSRPTSNTHCAC